MHWVRAFTTPLLCLKSLIALIIVQLAGKRCNLYCQFIFASHHEAGEHERSLCELAFPDRHQSCFSSHIEFPTLNRQGGTFTDVMDLIYFDWASNVQKAADIITNRHPRITSACAAEHTASLFFDNVFTNIDAYQHLCNFAKKLRGTLLGVRAMLPLLFLRSTVRNTMEG